MNIIDDRALVRRKKPLRVAILGSTGSIGTQALDVCAQHSDKVQVVALAAATRTAELVDQACKFHPRVVAVADKAHAQDGVLDNLPSGCELLSGPDGVTELCQRDDVDCVLVSVVGEAGIYAAYAALAAHKIVALANKESLVAGGDLLMPMAAPGKLIPVDSEHSAIFQCLQGANSKELARIWLTCSGGPFYGWDAQKLAEVTAQRALAHPTWSMGPKITIDSATLMNKGLEVIEAHHLFDVPVDDIQVLIHPQSKVHSMVEFCDGSTIAQLGPSDMRIAIQYAFSYPDRWEAPCPDVDWRDAGSLTFGSPDTSVFRCLALALEAGRAGGTLPCAMNAANEVANGAFRNGVIGFTDIASVVESVIDTTQVEPVVSLEQISQVDSAARQQARKVIGGLSC